MNKQNPPTPDELDEELRAKGWGFFGVILHYPNAYKEQGCIYRRGGDYIVTGLDSTGKTIFRDEISEDEACRRKDEALEEIREMLFGSNTQLFSQPTKPQE